MMESLISFIEEIMVSEQPEEALKELPVKITNNFCNYPGVPLGTKEELRTKRIDI